jgi:hypothetical protein
MKRSPIVKIACDHAPGPGFACIDCLRLACMQIVPETSEAQGYERGLTGALTTIGELQDLLALVRTERDALRTALLELRRSLCDALLARTPPAESEPPPILDVADDEEPRQ